MTYPTAGNSGPPGQGFNHAAPPSADRAHPSQAVSHRLSSVEPSPTGRPKTTKFTPAVGGPTHACQTAPSEHVDPPGLPHKLLLGTSSRQISNAYLGGNLSLAAVLHYIVFGGYSGFGPFPSSEPSPRTARLQRITILAKYALRLSC